MDNFKYKIQNKSTIEAIFSFSLNIIFILSSCAFAMLIYQPSTNLQIAMAMPYHIFYIIVASFYIFKYVPDLFFYQIRKINITTLILTTIGTLCTTLYLRHIPRGILPILLNCKYLVYFSLPFLVIALYLAYKFLINKITNFYKSLTKLEKYISLSFLIIGILLITIINSYTYMFVGLTPNGERYEVMSFDVAHCHAEQMFTNFFTSHNCIRHSIITLFSFPIFIIPTYLSVITGIEYISLISILIIQLFMILVIIILTKRHLKPASRLSEILICILLFISSSTIINTIVYEKFVFATFFIVLTINAVLNNSNEKYLYFIFSVGTLTSSLFLYPIVFFNKKTKIKDVLNKTLNCGCIIILILILNGQINDLIFGFEDLSLAIKGFGGSSVSIQSKLAQYFENFSIIFFMPNTICFNGELWYPETKMFAPLTILGFIILVITIIGYLFNKKDNFCKICFYWLIFLTFSDLIIGWGSALNEFFIYSLTYIWAIATLFYKGMFAIIRNKKFFNFTIILLILLIISYNSFRLHEIIEFGINHFPSSSMKSI